MGLKTNWTDESIPCIFITDFTPNQHSIAGAPTTHAFNVETNGVIGTINVYAGDSPNPAITPTAGTPVGNTTPYTVDLPAYSAEGIYTVVVEVIIGTTTVQQEFAVEAVA